MTQTKTVAMLLLIVIPTTIMFAFAILVLSFPLLFNQPVYSQMSTTNPGFQNLSSLLKNLLKPEKDISGHYSNPQFGIVDIVFPDSWHGRELPPIVGLTVIMHPGIDNKSSFPIPMSFSQPQMSLQVINNSELAGLNSAGGNPNAFSISKICKPLVQNTTSIIDGKTFNVATVECPFSSLISSAANSSNQSNLAYNSGSGPFKSPKPLFKSLNTNAIIQAKLYEFKSADKTYRLSLVVSNLLTSPSQSSEKPDISKYTQLLDATASTLKLR